MVIPTQTSSPTSLVLGGLKLSDKNRTILSGNFLTPPIGEISRTAFIEGDESLFISVLPTSTPTNTNTVLLEVKYGKVSYTTSPGNEKITINGTFYAAQPSSLSLGDRFIYTGSLVLPIKTVEEELAKGYEIVSIVAASNDDLDGDLQRTGGLYLAPRTLTLKSGIEGQSQSKPSVAVNGEFIATGPYGFFDLFSSLTGIENFTVNYSDDGKKDEVKPTLRAGQKFAFSIPKLGDYKLEAANAEVQFDPYDSKWAIRLGGDYKLKTNDKNKFAGGISIVNPDNYFQLGGGGTKFKGSVNVKYIPIPPCFAIKDFSVELDTDTLSDTTISGSFGLLFNPLEILGIVEPSPLRSYGATIGLSKGKINSVGLNIDNLSTPLGTTPYILTAINGKLDNLANENPASASLGISFKSKLELFGEPKTQGKVNGTFSLKALRIDGELEIIPGFSNKFLGIEGFADGNADFIADRSKGTLAGKMKVNIMANFLNGRINFAGDKMFNFGFIGDLNANIPRPIPIIGGKNLGNVGSGIQYINDNTYSNDFAAAWFGVNLLFARKQFGAKVVFDGTYKFLGADSIAEVKAEIDGTIKRISEGDLNKAISATTGKSESNKSKEYLPVSIDLRRLASTDQILALSSASFTGQFRNTYNFVRRNALRDRTLSNQRYYIPVQAVFLEDVAKIIPELSSEETAFYLIDLDLFKLKTGSDFAGFSASTPTTDAFNKGPLPSNFFGLGAELFKVTQSPDITLSSFERLLKPRLPSEVFAFHIDRIVTSPDGEGVDKAFDDNVGTKWFINGKENSGIVFTYNNPTRINHFTITTAIDFPERDPAFYKLAGRNNYWDKWEEISAGSLLLPQDRLATGSRIYTANTKDFSQYKIIFPFLRDTSTANGLQLAELSLFEGNKPGFPLGETIALPSNAFAFYDASESLSSPNGETVDKAFDGNVKTKWFVFEGENSGLLLTYKNPTLVKSFTITTANDFPERDPTSYKLAGRNNYWDNWEEISAGSLTLPMDRFATGQRIFTKNTSSYSQYKIVFPTVRSRSDSSLQFAELNLFGEDLFSLGSSVRNMSSPSIHTVSPGGDVVSNSDPSVLLGSTIKGMSSPSMFTVFRGEDVAINYEASDPDSDAIISFYHDTDGVEANGVFIATGVQERDGVAFYTWDTKDVLAGTYFVYAVIDDGNNMPIYSYLPNPIRVLDPEVLPQLQGVAGQWSGNDSVELSWQADPEAIYYVVSYTNSASGDRNEEEESLAFEATEESRLRLTGLKPGDYYRFTVKAINEAGNESLPSDPIAVLVGDRYTAPLEAGEWEFEAYAGSLYTWDLPLNLDQKAVLLRGPQGAMIKDGKIVWKVPKEIDQGMHELAIQIGDMFGNEYILERRLMVSNRIGEPKRTSNYSYTTSADAIDEGSSLSIGVSTTDATPGSPLFWRFSGAGITAADFSDGRLEGSTVIGTDGRAGFTKAISADAINDPYETLELRFYSDATRSQQVGSTIGVILRQPTTGLITDDSDILTGSNAAETLIGVPMDSALRGRASLDRLTGGGGDDLFALGDTEGRFYDDGTPGLGSADLATVTDFNNGDRIQLHGFASDYRLVRARYAGVAGVRIDAVVPTPEAIGFVQGVTLASLNLANSSQFQFV